MAQTLRRLTPLAAAVPLGLLWLGPLVLAVISIALSLKLDDVAAFWLTPHVGTQLAFSILIGSFSTLIATALALWLAVSLPMAQRSAWLGAYLAVPHLAFAVGLTFLIMPAGLLARLLFDVPPQWTTVQDPYGLALMATLVLKEVPFLLWLMHAILSRADFAAALGAQQQASRSLGHGSWSTAWRITAPQLTAQLVWPLAIVWVYGCSVVDVTLVIGPAQPAPAQISIWHDLNDADAAINSRGLAGVAMLTGALAMVALAVVLCCKMARPLWREWLVRGPDQRNTSVLPAVIVKSGFATVYALVMFLLLVLSFTQRWPFPALLPQAVSTSAWAHVLAEPRAILNSLGFAVSTSATSLILSLLWFECCSRRWDRLVTAAALLALVLPAIALAAGQYQLMLRLNLNGSSLGVYLAQIAPVFAYLFLTLAGPYRAFDERYRAAASGLNSSSWRFLTKVKWPLLKGPLASASAIGFAVSMAQYVPVLLVGAGGTPTLTTEAVTLASGGNRAVLAAYALALSMLTAAAFGIASMAGARRAS